MGGGFSKKPKPPAPARRGRRESVSAASDAVAYTKVKIEKSAEAYARIEGAVKDNFLFSALDANQKQEIYDAMFEKAVGAGEVIINEGAEGDYFYIVESGGFDVFTAKNKAGADKPVFHYDAGGSFGELALMYNAPRAATVKATEASTVWGLDRDTFTHVIVETNRRKARMEETVLLKVEPLQALSDGERAAVADAVTRVEFGDGDAIVTQGDARADTRRFYMVESGTVRLVVDGDDAGAKTLGPGDFFGARALLGDGTQPASAIAAGPVSCAAMTGADFERLLGPCRDVLAKAEA